mmetsp:Transcript_148863/g.414769  ORF Transcript_148863/g.414769 Transcript_148863/m.414769 type:complete len:273 (-) Transcript_148863:386-1204(-)
MGRLSALTGFAQTECLVPGMLPIPGSRSTWETELSASTGCGMIRRRCWAPWPSRNSWRWPSAGARAMRASARRARPRPPAGANRVRLVAAAGPAPAPAPWPPRHWRGPRTCGPWRLRSPRSLPGPPARADTLPRSPLAPGLRRGRATRTGARAGSASSTGRTCRRASWSAGHRCLCAASSARTSSWRWQKFGVAGPAWHRRSSAATACLRTSSYGSSWTERRWVLRASCCWRHHQWAMCAKAVELSSRRAATKCTLLGIPAGWCWRTTWLGS